MYYFVGLFDVDYLMDEIDGIYTYLMPRIFIENLITSSGFTMSTEYATTYNIKYITI